MINMLGVTVVRKPEVTVSSPAVGHVFSYKFADTREHIPSLIAKIIVFLTKIKVFLDNWDLFLRNYLVRDVAESNYFVLRMLIKNLGYNFRFSRKNQKKLNLQRSAKIVNNKSKKLIFLQFVGIK